MKERNSVFNFVSIFFDDMFRIEIVWGLIGIICNWDFVRYKFVGVVSNKCIVRVRVKRDGKFKLVRSDLKCLY